MEVLRWQRWWRMRCLLGRIDPAWRYRPLGVVGFLEGLDLPHERDHSVHVGRHTVHPFVRYFQLGQGRDVLNRQRVNGHPIYLNEPNSLAKNPD